MRSYAGGVRSRRGVNATSAASAPETQWSHRTGHEAISPFLKPAARRGAGKIAAAISGDENVWPQVRLPDQGIYAR